jgi:hypothetical protein
MTVRRKRPVDEATLFGDYFDDEDEEEARYQRPAWLHEDCANTCLALELGTCCKYPDNPLVQCAVELADSVDRTLRQIEGGDCARSAAQLARQLTCVPGLLVQIHAILPRLNQTAVAQFLCPVGRLRGALDQAFAYGCPWACGDPDVPERRSEFAQLRLTLAKCSEAIRTALGWKVAA